MGKLKLILTIVILVAVLVIFGWSLYNFIDCVSDGGSWVKAFPTYVCLGRK
jgi:hypothetical protein